MFHTLDFILFGLFLLLSLIVGVYHAILAKFFAQTDGPKQKRSHTKTAEFLTGGRQLPVIPVCLSLLSTFTSGIGLLSVPAEIYTRGFTWGISYISGAMAFPVIAALFIPVFYKLKFLNAYEYFEMRFRSAMLRRMASLLFIFNTMIYLAVVVYAPAIALTGVTGLKLWPLILAVGGVCTIYTAAGGIKAVIWTDTLQAIFIYVGIAWLIIKGTMEAGGFAKVIEINEASGRLTQAVLQMDPTLFQYNSIWISLIGGLLHWLSSYGLNQMAIQRYCSMRSLNDARLVLWLAMPAIIVIGLMKCYIGILMGAYFAGCDPLSIKEITSVDQMTILMAARVLDSIPGLPGLFLATLFSATLSTISSGINSITTVLWEDFLKTPCHHLSDSGATICIKFITLCFGALAIFMAFACYSLGGIFHVCITILGATTGPLVGLFFLGIFFPKANKYGAIAGILGATFLMIICAVMNNLEMPYQNYVLRHQPENYTSPGCVQYPAETAEHLLANQKSYFAEHGPEFHFGSPQSHWIARLSPFNYSAFGVILVILIGVPVSYLFPHWLPPDEKRFVYACTLSGLKIRVDDETVRKFSTRSVEMLEAYRRAKISIHQRPDTEVVDPLVQ